MKIIPRIIQSRLRSRPAISSSTSACAGPQPTKAGACPPRVLGALFEQFVGLELLRATREVSASLKLQFWRDPDGPEVDWIVVGDDRWVPVEVKWSDAPAERDTRHLQTFLSEYPKAREGVVVCRTPRRFKIAAKITAIPWQEIHSLVEV